MKSLNTLENSEDAQRLERRIDGLPMSRHLWSLVLLLSLGTFFETYELSLTAMISPGLVKAGIFARENGLLGLPDQAAFAAATFLGMFIGALGLGQIADRIGRKRAFTASILIYTAATLLMALQQSALGMDICRFIGGIGLGAEIVTVDAYIAEIVPARYRGRAFAFATFIQFLAVPVAGAVSLLLVPNAPLGVEGWRWVCLIGAIGGLVVLLTRMRVPESPRWLAQRGLLHRAFQIVDALEKKSGMKFNPTAEPLLHQAPAQNEPKDASASQSLWHPAWRRRVVMLTLAHVFITTAFYGLANWLPSFLIAQGHSVVKSFQYTLYINLCYPLCPLIFMLFADKIERKWQLAFATIASAVFAVVLGRQTSDVGIVIIGLAGTTCNLLTAYCIHTYQSELFPSGIRARAIGFVYSWGRLTAVFSSLIIGYLLQTGGTNAVFAFIAGCFVLVSVLVTAIGPRTFKHATAASRPAQPGAAIVDKA